MKIKGEIDNTQIMDIYRTVDVVMCASREDAMSVVVAEGCMMRKTSIVSSTVGIAEFLDHEKTGLVFESENVDELSGWIQWVVEHPLEIKQLGINSQDIYDKFFSINVHTTNLLAAINSVMRSYRLVL